MDLVYNPRFSKVVQIVADQRMVCSRTVMAGMPYPGYPVPLEVGLTTPSAPACKEQKEHWLWGLRFPRIGPQGVREKGWTVCMTQTELWDSIKKCKTSQAVPAAARTPCLPSRSRTGSRH
jgi:hypothetical protein